MGGNNDIKKDNCKKINKIPHPKKIESKTEDEEFLFCLQGILKVAEFRLKKWENIPVKSDSANVRKLRPRFSLTHESEISKVSSFMNSRSGKYRREYENTRNSLSLERSTGPKISSSKFMSPRTFFQNADNLVEAHPIYQHLMAERFENEIHRRIVRCPLAPLKLFPYFQTGTSCHIKLEPVCESTPYEEDESCEHIRERSVDKIGERSGQRGEFNTIPSLILIKGSNDSSGTRRSNCNDKEATSSSIKRHLIVKNLFDEELKILIGEISSMENKRQVERGDNKSESCVLSSRHAGKCNSECVEEMKEIKEMKKFTSLSGEAGNIWKTEAGMSKEERGLKKVFSCPPISLHAGEYKNLTKVTVMKHHQGGETPLRPTKQDIIQKNVCKKRLNFLNCGKEHSTEAVTSEDVACVNITNGKNQRKNSDIILQGNRISKYSHFGSSNIFECDGNKNKENLLSKGLYARYVKTCKSIDGSDFPKIFHQDIIIKNNDTIAGKIIPKTPPKDKQNLKTSNELQHWSDVNVKGRRALECSKFESNNLYNEHLSLRSSQSEASGRKYCMSLDDGDVSKTLPLSLKKESNVTSSKVETKNLGISNTVQKIVIEETQHDKQNLNKSDDLSSESVNDLQSLIQKELFVYKYLPALFDSKNSNENGRCFENEGNLINQHKDRSQFSYVRKGSTRKQQENKGKCFERHENIEADYNKKVSKLGLGEAFMENVVESNKKPDENRGIFQTDVELQHDGVFAFEQTPIQQKLIIDKHLNDFCVFKKNEHCLEEDGSCFIHYKNENKYVKVRDYVTEVQHEVDKTVEKCETSLDNAEVGYNVGALESVVECDKELSVKYILDIKEYFHDVTDQKYGMKCSGSFMKVEHVERKELQKYHLEGDVKIKVTTEHDKNARRKGEGYSATLPSIVDEDIEETESCMSDGDKYFQATNCGNCEIKFDVEDNKEHYSFNNNEKYLEDIKSEKLPIQENQQFPGTVEETTVANCDEKIVSVEQSNCFSTAVLDFPSPMRTNSSRIFRNIVRSMLKNIW